VCRRLLRLDTATGGGWIGGPPLLPIWWRFIWMIIPDRHVTRIDGYVTPQLLALVNYMYSRTFNRDIHSWARPTIFCIFLPSSICNVKNIFMNCTGYLYLLRLLSGGHRTCQPWWEIFDSPFRDQEVLPRNDNYAMSKLPHCYRDRERRFPGGGICKGESTDHG
jgi:hypothetical protein